MVEKTASGTEKLRYRSELVGREDDVKKLREHFNMALSGRGQTIFIEGEAGIGKTRLIQEFCNVVGKDQVKLLYGRGIEGATPYLAFVEALRNYLKVNGTPGLSTTKDLLETIKDIQVARSTEVGKHGSYLVPGAYTDRSYELFGNFVHRGFSGLCVSTEYPDNLKEKYQLQDADFLWLTDVSGHEEAVNPKRFEFELTKEISSFIKANKGGAVLLDGFDYLVLENGFENVVRFTKKVTDLANMNSSTIFVPINPKSLDPKEMAVVQRHLEILGSSGAIKIEDAGRHRERMFDDVLNLISEMSKEKPIVLFIDDMQWLDQSSLDLLNYIANNVRNNKVMIMGAYRPEDVATPEDVEPHGLTKMLRELSKNVLYNVVALKRLNHEQISALLDSMFSNNEFGADFKKFVFNEGGGNPFYTEEITDALLKEKVIRQEEDKWMTSDFSRISIPQTISDVVLRRVERLDPKYKKMVECMAAIGQASDFTVLENTLKMDEEDLAISMDELVNLKIIRECTAIDGYEFDHGIIQQVVYNSLSRSGKLIWHKRIGTALEEIYRGRLEDVSFELAHHFGQTRDKDRALEYNMMAGRIAESKFAFDEMMKYYDIAREVLEKKEDNFETFEKLIEISKKVAYISQIRGTWEEATFYYNYLKDIAKKIDDNHYLSEAERGLGYMQWRSAEYPKALEFYKSALEYANMVEDKHSIGILYIDMGNVYNDTGNPEKAIEYYNKSIGILNGFEDYGEIARAYNNLGDIAMKTELWSDAVDYFNKCGENGKKADRHDLMGWALFNMGEANAKRKRLEEAGDQLEKAMELLEPINDLIGMSAIYKNYGIIFRYRKDWDNAVDNFEKGIQLVKGLNIPYNLAEYLVEYGKMYQDKGNIEKAEELFNKAIEIWQDIGSFEKIKQVNEMFEELEKKMD
jgi:tetratricopeptide (TPR) repeat protein/Cdc6-like AAA superfamily ATPase